MRPPCSPSVQPVRRRPDRRDRLRRPRRRPPPQGAGQGRHRTADRRQPLPQHASTPSPPASPPSRAGHTHYCPSPGLPSFREAVARNYAQEFGVAIGPENVVVGPGAKVFEQFFCEAFLDPGDAVLVFSPQFPTYAPNIERRGGVDRHSAAAAGERLPPQPRRRGAASSRRTRRPGPIFLNSPHNPTGGVATADDMRGLADIIRGREHRPVQRRAVLPHGLAGPARDAAGAAGHARPDRRGLHVQQVVQHERLAARLRRLPPARRRHARQDDQHDAVVRAAAGPARRAGGARARRRRARRGHGAVPEEGRTARRGAAASCPR